MDNLGEITSALKFSRVLTLDELDERTRQRVLAIYCHAFADAPYYENFTPGEAAARLRHTLERGGDLLLGEMEGTAASFVGGYPKTAVGGCRARALYESVGFAPAGTEAVPARRQGGVVSARRFIPTPLNTKRPRPCLVLLTLPTDAAHRRAAGGNGPIRAQRLRK